MESILHPLPSWLVLFVVLFVALQVARFLLVYVVPTLLGVVCIILKKFLYLVSYPVMAMISSRMRDRRESGNPGVPIWVDSLEGVLAFFERSFTMLIGLTRNRKRYNGMVKKWSFYAAVGFAVLLTAVVVKYPNEWYPGKWGSQEAQVEPITKAARPALKEYFLNPQYQDGGNIREVPNLSARRLYTIRIGEKVYYLNEEQVDSRGIKWLKVKTVDGNVVGWISANIVREINR